MVCSGLLAADEAALPVGIQFERQLKRKEQFLAGQIDAAELLDLLNPVVDGIAVDEQHLRRPRFAEAALRIHPKRLKQLCALFGIVLGQPLQSGMTALCQQFFIVDPVQDDVQTVVQIEEERGGPAEAVREAQCAPGCSAYSANREMLEKMLLAPMMRWCFWANAVSISNKSEGMVPFSSVSSRPIKEDW